MTVTLKEGIMLSSLGNGEEVLENNQILDLWKGPSLYDEESEYIQIRKTIMEYGGGYKSRNYLLVSDIEELYQCIEEENCATNSNTNIIILLK